MMNRILVLALFVLVTQAAKAQLVTESAFQDSILQYGLTFAMPEGYKAVPIKENRDLYYNFAMTNKRKSIEVRYTITNLDYFVKEYAESLKDSTRSFIDPNVLYRSAILANTMNLNGGNFPEVGYFPETSVKNEFGADAGGSTFFEFNSEFGKGWKYGQIVFLHLDNVCDVYITFMTNKLKKHVDLMMESFYALRFG